MIIQHHIEVPKKFIERGALLVKITEVIPEFYNWNAKLNNEKISFEHDGKFRFVKMPTDFIKSGTIDLTERTDTFLFTCRTTFPNYYALFCLAVFTVGIIQKYVFGYPFPLVIVILLPFLLYFGNWYYIKRAFKWSTNKVIKHILDKQVSS